MNQVCPVNKHGATSDTFHLNKQSQSVATPS